MLTVNEIFYSIQGESTYAGLPCIFIRLTACHLRCTWCFAPDTRILMADWSWKPIEGVTVGDMVVGLRKKGSRLHYQMTPAMVTAKTSRRAGVVRLSSDDSSIICTPEHKFWETTHGEYWKQAKSFRPGDQIRFVASPVEFQETDEFIRGWLGGVAAGDGCFWDLRKDSKRYRRFRLALKDEGLLDAFQVMAEKFGYNLHFAPHQHNGFRGRTVMNALWLTRDAVARAFEDFIFRDGNSDYRRGWLAGFFDADGSWSGYIQFAQKESSPHWSRLSEFLHQEGFQAKNSGQGIRIGASVEESVRFLMSCPSVLSRKRRGLFGASVRNSTVVREVQPLQKIYPVYNLTTETGNYVAEGFVVKNCDTEYAFYEGKKMSVGQVLSEMQKFKCNLVEITGGEPLLQKDVYLLIDRLLERGYKVLIETSGSLSVKDLDKRVIKIMDLKCPASGEAERNDYSNIEQLTAQDEVKFVIADRPDYLWAKETMQRFSLPEKVTVLFSPVYQTLDPERLAAWILEDSLPVRMQLQMHKVIWGDRRGV